MTAAHTTCSTANHVSAVSSARGCPRTCARLPPAPLRRTCGRPPQGQVPSHGPLAAAQGGRVGDRVRFRSGRPAHLPDVAQLVPALAHPLLAGRVDPVLHLGQARLHVLAVAERAALAAQQQLVEQLRTARPPPSAAGPACSAFACLTGMLLMTHRPSQRSTLNIRHRTRATRASQPRALRRAPASEARAGKLRALAGGPLQQCSAREEAGGRGPAGPAR